MYKKSNYYDDIVLYHRICQNKRPSQQHCDGISVYYGAIANTI